MCMLQGLSVWHCITNWCALAEEGHLSSSQLSSVIYSFRVQMRPCGIFSVYCGIIHCPLVSSLISSLCESPTPWTIKYSSAIFSKVKVGNMYQVTIAHLLLQDSPWEAVWQTLSIFPHQFQTLQTTQSFPEKKKFNGSLSAFISLQCWFIQ